MNGSSSDETKLVDVEKSGSSLVSLLHPGHCLLASSILCFYGSHRRYRASLDDVVYRVLQKTSAGSAWETSKAEVGVRRAVGTAVAVRALSVATMGSLGTFGLFGALAFYASGYKTVEEAVRGTTEWAQSGRRRMESMLGVESRVDMDDPEIRKLTEMTEDEQLNYISKKYFPVEEWGLEVESDDKKPS
jgi:hypothetical protein